MSSCFSVESLLLYLMAKAETNVFNHNIPEEVRTRLQTLPVVILFAGMFGSVALYSLIISASFGHSTFWRGKALNEGLDLSHINIHAKSKKSRWESFIKRGTIKRKSPSKEQLLRIANDDVWLGALNYLNAAELLVFQCTSRHCKTLTDASPVWDQLDKLTFSLEACEYMKHNPHNTNNPSAGMNLNCTTVNKMKNKKSTSAKMNFFLKLRQYPKFLMELPHNSEKLLVIINNRLYDLTRFAEEHPGGYFILDQYKGRDASRPFELAHHSKLALSVAESLVMWDPITYMGKQKGWPKFALVQPSLLATSNSTSNNQVRI